MPVLPLAPGLFSTITVVFSASPSGVAIERAMMSDDPPGVYGTTIRIVLVGPRLGQRDRRREGEGQACEQAGGESSLHGGGSPARVVKSSYNSA